MKHATILLAFSLAVTVLDLLNPGHMLLLLWFTALAWSLWYLVLERKK